jgi:hypothetical protein
MWLAFANKGLALEFFKLQIEVIRKAATHYL